jgi:hypothetical protein
MPGQRPDRITAYQNIKLLNSNYLLPPCLMVPLTWIEHVTSPLPRECSTTELQGLTFLVRASQHGASTHSY